MTDLLNPTLPDILLDIVLFSISGLITIIWMKISPPFPKRKSNEPEGDSG